MDSQTILADAQRPTTTSSTLSNRPSYAQISIKDFLNFLKTAYQVQDTVEGVLLAGGMTEAVNWLKQKENNLLQKHKSTASQTVNEIPALECAKKKSSAALVNSEPDPIKRKLSEVLNEGLLDSVLPYLVQNASAASSKKSVKISEKSSILSQITACSSDKAVKKTKSIDQVASNSSKNHISKTDSEVEIHVCDEVKNMKKNFVCNQLLLVEKMGYFAEVTLGQRLEDMDISVHCDIGIFEWLMQWVKKESLLEEDWPQLDPQCVIPILVSAAFLQMEPLLNDCLLFCHERMNEILKTSTNLSCLNDLVLTRLAAMYTNSEIESIKDRKDKIQSRLFSKLIMSLAEPEAESVRGHWNSLAQVSRCEKCQQLINPSVALKIPCVPSCMRLQTDGSIISLHVRDPTWNINEYILKLHKSLRTWRKVYWRLWGDAHFLYCSVCKRFFPSNQIAWCRYHPDTPQFFTLDAQKAPLPIGRYPCCGERAYRFQLLDNYSGCQFRQHVVANLEDVRDCAVVAMLEEYRHLIEEEPAQLLFPETLTRLVARDPNVSDKKFVCKESFWWDGLELIPPRPKLGLLSGFASRAGTKEEVVEEVVVSEESSEECSEEDSSSSSTSSSSSSAERSVESTPNPIVVKKLPSKKKRYKSIANKLWQQNLSARSNQDIQRAYEEKAVKEMSAILTKKTAISEAMHQRQKGLSRTASCQGGIWMRLESEWRENLNLANIGQPNKFKTFHTKLKARGKFA